MRVIDRFGSLAGHLASDAKIQKYALIVARHGVKGLGALNPATVWLDAGLAICDAVSAYQTYARESEITRQLAEETRLLERELKAMLTSLKLDLDLQDRQERQRVEIINAALNANQQRAQQVMADIASKVQLVYNLAKTIRLAREKSGRNFRQIQELQRDMDSLLRISLQCVLQSVGSNWQQ